MDFSHEPLLQGLIGKRLLASSTRFYFYNFVNTNRSFSSCELKGPDLVFKNITTDCRGHIICAFRSIVSISNNWQLCLHLF